MAQTGRVLIYGGRGALGAKCVSHFKANNYVSKKLKQLFYIVSLFLIQWVASIDLAENSEADLNIIVKKEDSFQQQVKTLFLIFQSMMFTYSLHYFRNLLLFRWLNQLSMNRNLMVSSVLLVDGLVEMQKRVRSNIPVSPKLHL